MRVLRFLKANPDARLRLFCLPFAGGIGLYNSWYDRFPLDLQRVTEVCSVLLPGHESNGKAALFSTLGPLIEWLVPAITSAADKPFAFFGHSMGALVSFELARHLRRNSLPLPIHLVVSGHRAPQLQDQHPAIYRLPETEFRQHLRLLGGTPEEVLDNPELMELLGPVLRADFEVCETYQYAGEQPLECSITAFGGNSDPRVSRAELAAWQAQTRNSFSIRMFPGGHFFIHSAEMLVLRVLAEDLKTAIGRLPRAGRL